MYNTSAMMRSSPGRIRPVSNGIPQDGSHTSDWPTTSGKDPTAEGVKDAISMENGHSHVTRSSTRLALEENNGAQSQNDRKEQSTENEFTQTFKLSFHDKNLEETFKTYVILTRHSTTLFTFLLSIALNISGLITAGIDYSSDLKYYIIGFSLCALMNCTLLILSVLGVKQRRTPSLLLIILFWALYAIQVGVHLPFSSIPLSVGSDVIWITSVCYLTYILYPLRIRYCVLLNLVLIILHTTIVICVPKARGYVDKLQYGYSVSTIHVTRVW